jgi:predicted glycoside hydrolase/deacetylase ChbG (UPF0249 family)
LLCITADDYGMAACVNEAIEELAAAGRISAVAVMVHRGAVLDRLDRLRASGVAIGLHVVATQESPLLSALEGTPLAPAGRMPDSPFALLRALVGRPHLRRLLTAEIEAQADRYRALGLPLDFVNSHEHVHEWPPLWRIVAELVDQRRIPAVRSAHGQPLTWTRQGALALVSRISRRLRPPAFDARILSPLGAGQAGRMSLPEVDALVSRGIAWHGEAGGVLAELVVHPSVDDEPLRARYGPARAGQRRREYDLLRSDELAALWHRRGVELAGPASLLLDAHRAAAESWKRIARRAEQEATGSPPRAARARKQRGAQT